MADRHDIIMDSEHGQQMRQKADGTFYRKVRQDLEDVIQETTNPATEPGAANRAVYADAVQQAQKTNLKKEDKLRRNEDQVDLSFHWENDESGSPRLEPHLRDTLVTSVDVENDSQKILRILGYKIDLTSKLSELKQSFIQNIIQSRSHNFFLSRFASFKVGMLGQTLSLLGVSPEEIQTLKKEAIANAIKENKALMEENIYNMELTELVYGKGAKLNKAMAMFKEVEQQLVRQMNMLGQQNYWNPARLLEERLTQCRKIREELEKERKTLQYMYDYMVQRGV